MMEDNLFRGEQKLSIFFIHFTSLVKTIWTFSSENKAKFSSAFSSHPFYPRAGRLYNNWQCGPWLQYWAGSLGSRECWHSSITYCYNLCLIWLVTGAIRHRPSPYLKWDPQTQTEDIADCTQTYLSFCLHNISSEWRRIYLNYQSYNKVKIQEWKKLLKRKITGKVCLLKLFPLTPEQILSRGKSYFPRGRMQSYEFLMSWIISFVFFFVSSLD